MGRNIIRRNGKLCRDNQRYPIDSLGWGNVGKLMGGGTVGKEQPGQMCNPIWRGTAGPKGGFEASVETFNHAIRLRTESCGGDV